MTEQERELETQRGRADRAYQNLVAHIGVRHEVWARDAFQDETTRLIALELRWANRQVT